MKVTDVSAMILRYQYDNAIADAQNYFYTRSAVIVKVKTDEGIEGIGESACFGGPAETTKYVIEHELADLVRGRTRPISNGFGARSTTAPASTGGAGSSPPPSAASMWRCGIF